MTYTDKALAFASIAAELKLFIPLLASSDRGEQLAAVRNIGDALLSAHLTWLDLAARVTAPSAALVAPPHSSIPPMPPPFTPKAEPFFGPDAVLTDEELRHFGYRQRGTDYDYEPRSISDADMPKPSEQ